MIAGRNARQRPYDVLIMKISRIAVVVVAASLFTGAHATPADADTTSNVDQFLTTLDGLGITNLNPADAVGLGQSLCPLLAQRSQNTADIAAKVSDSIGKPLGIGTMFTGAAVSFLCPKAVANVTDSLTNGRLPFPIFGNS